MSTKTTSQHASRGKSKAVSAGAPENMNPTKPNADAVRVPVREGDDPDEASTQIMMGPHVANAGAMMSFGKRTASDLKIGHVMTTLLEAAKKVRKNDMSDVEATLVSQAMALNVMFGDLSRRSESNLTGGYFEAGERYLRLALKAQSQCRTTLETLGTIKNPPVVYARQANFANGPQQVNNGTAPATRASETGTPPNKLLEQSHGQCLDTGTPNETGRTDSAVEAVGEIDRSKFTSR